MPSSQPGSHPDGRTPAQRQTDHARLARLSETLVPALVHKLAVSGLGELEVHEGEWRIRVRRPVTHAPVVARRVERPRLGTHGDRDREGRATREAGASAGRGPGASEAPYDGRPAAAVSEAPDEPRRAVAVSPAVGVFRPGPAIGTSVRAGDPVGVVDLLGIPQEVPAPIDGTLIEVFPEPGEAVEYGETIAAVEAGLAPPLPESTADVAGDARADAPAEAAPDAPDGGEGSGA